MRFLGVNHLGHKNALIWSFVQVSEIRRTFDAAKFGSLFTFLGIHLLRERAFVFYISGQHRIMQFFKATGLLVLGVSS